MLAREDSQYWWYRSHSIEFSGLTWEFTYIEATANRSIATTDENGTRINLQIPIKDSCKFPSPLAWLEKWGKTNGKGYIEARKAPICEPIGLFNAQGESLEITPSNRGEEKPCLPTLTVSREAGDSPSRRKEPGASKQSKRSTTTPTLNSSGARISQPSLFPGISENLEGSEENTTLSVAGFLAQGPATPEREPDSLTPNQPSGAKESDCLSNADPDFLLLNNLREWSIEDFERFLDPSEWRDIRGTIRKSLQRASAEPDTVDPDFLLFPTLTANKGATNRPAGQSRCEKWWRDAKLISNGLQLSGAAMAAIMGFPLGWYKALEAENSRAPNILPSPIPPAESEADTSPVERSHRPKRGSSSIESSFSTTSDSGATTSAVAPIKSVGTLLGVNEPVDPNCSYQRYAPDPSSEISPSKSSSTNSQSAGSLLGVNEGKAIETLLLVNEGEANWQSQRYAPTSIETKHGVNNAISPSQEISPSKSSSTNSQSAGTLLGVNEGGAIDQIDTLLGVNDGGANWQSQRYAPDQIDTLLGVNESPSPEISPSKCFSCYYSDRIRTSALYVCLTDGHYFTEATAKECERFTPAGKLEAIEPTEKRPRRRRGQGSGSFITRYANQTKSGKKYPQTSYQVEFGGKKRSIYIPAEKVERIRELDRAGKPIKEILEAIDSPKSREVLEEYKGFLKSKLGF